MAQNIGGTACTFVHDSPGKRLPSERVRVYQPAGYDGYGAQKIGIGDGEFGYMAVLYDTGINVEAWAVTLFGKKATVVDIEDDHGTVHGNMLLVEMGHLERSPAGTLVRGSIRVQGVQVSLP